MRHVWVSLLLATTMLAGCSEAPPVETTDDPALDDVEVKATATTGVIRGIVVDSAIVPVVGATVGIIGGERSTVTNENGGFGFQDLQPGSYFLKVSKAGWTEVQAAADVKAGVDRPPIVKIQMLRDPSTQPYVIPAVYDAYIQCAESLILVGYNGPCSNDFLVDYGPDELGRTPDFAQSELVWESTQALGDWMAFLYSAPRAGQTLLYNYQEVEGPSPLTIRANKTLMEENGVIDGYPLQIRIFNSGIEGTDIGRDFGDPRDGDDCIERPQLGGCMVGFGATIDQLLTSYTHTFFNFVPPEDWRFVEQGPPTIP